MRPKLYSQALAAIARSSNMPPWALPHASGSLNVLLILSEELLAGSKGFDYAAGDLLPLYVGLQLPLLEGDSCKLL